MSITIRKIMLVLALLCFTLVSCEPANCDLQLVAGGAKACQESRK
jgi:hypothetical protein